MSVASGHDDEVIRPRESRHLLEYWFMVVRRRRLVGSLALLLTAALGVRALVTRPVYRGTAQLLVERTDPQVLDFKEITQLDAHFGEDYYQTQFRLLQSRALASKVIERLGLLADPEFGGPRPPDVVKAALAAPIGQSALLETTITAVESRLAVQWQRNTRLMSVSFDAHRPDLAAQVTNAFAQLYIEQSLQLRYETSSGAASWLGEQMRQQRDKVEEATLQLQKLKEKEGIANIEERRTLVEQKLKDLGGALVDMKKQRLEKEGLYTQMRQVRDIEELPEVIRSPVVQALRVDLATLQRQEAQLLERYLDQHPEVLKVRNQIGETQRRIAAEAQRVVKAAENDYKAALLQERNVEEALEAAKAESLDLSRRGVRYDSLKRELDANQAVLASLASRSKQTDVAQELRATNIQIVDQATPPADPVSPRPIRDMALGLLFGLLVGCGLTFFLDYLDRTVKTPEDVRQHVQAPLLAVVPQTDNVSRERLVLLDPAGKGPFPEGYRVLRTALSYCWPGGGPRVICVSSTLPREGKTLTAVNLALALAARDGNVLLMDGDLRRPALHSVLKVKRAPGLADILTGKAKPSETIQRVAGTSLSVMSSGGHVPSPADLLTTGVLKGLIDGLRGYYTWVVVDTAPIGAVPDALVFAPLTDGLLVVVGSEMVHRNAVGHTLERVATTGARVLGVVLNHADVERHSYYYGKYYGHYAGHYYATEPGQPGRAPLRAVRAGRNALP